MGVVYVMKVKDRNLFKIGHCSSDIRARISAIRVGCPFPVGLYATIESEGIELEREIQSKLTQVETNGEWYDNSLEELLEVLSEYPDTKFHECIYEYGTLKKVVPRSTDKVRKKPSTGKRKHRRKSGRPSMYCPGPYDGEKCVQEKESGERTRISKRAHRCKRCKRRGTYLRSLGVMPQYKKAA